MRAEEFVVSCLLLLPEACTLDSGHTRLGWGVGGSNRYNIRQFYMLKIVALTMALFAEGSGSAREGANRAGCVGKHKIASACVEVPPERSRGQIPHEIMLSREEWVQFFDCGRVLFGSRVAKREAEGTVHTKHQLNLDPNPEGT